jgi:hypothetical protein
MKTEKAGVKGRKGRRRKQLLIDLKKIKDSGVGKRKHWIALCW